MFHGVGYGHLPNWGFGLFRSQRVCSNDFFSRDNFIFIYSCSYIIHRGKKLRQRSGFSSTRLRRLRRSQSRLESVPSRSVSDDGSLDRMIPLPVSENRPSLLQRLEYGRPVIRLQGFIIDNGTVVQNAPFNNSIIAAIQQQTSIPPIEVDTSQLHVDTTCLDTSCAQLDTNFSTSIEEANSSVGSPCPTDTDEPPHYSQVSLLSRPPSFSPPPPYDECVTSNTAL